jgi:hypothetical protein
MIAPGQGRVHTRAVARGRRCRATDQAAGRYAVVLGGLAYDFTVDGPITASAQCLESFEALNGPVFSECRPG